MRTLAATLGLLFAASTANAASLDLVWTGSSNTAAGGLGTSAVTALPGDQLTLTLQFNLEAGDSVSFVGVSVQFDNDGANELDLISTEEFNWAPTVLCQPFPACFTQFGPQLTNTTAGITSSLDSQPGTGGYANTFEMSTLGTGPSGPLTIPLGTMTFTVNSPLSDGTDLISGFLNAGIDGAFQNDGSELPMTFGNAEVNVIPEPTTAALVALGLAGLGLAGRSRR